jgi:hypothetical protein
MAYRENPLHEFTEIKFLLDGHELRTCGTDDVVQIESPMPNIPADDPDHVVVDSPRVYFFRVNGKTIALANQYTAYVSEWHPWQLVIKLQSESLISNPASH